MVLGYFRNKMQTPSKRRHGIPKILLTFFTGKSHTKESLFLVDQKCKEEMGIFRNVNCDTIKRNESHVGNFQF